MIVTFCGHKKACDRNGSAPRMAYRNGGMSDSAHPTFIFHGGCGGFGSMAGSVMEKSGMADSTDMMAVACTWDGCHKVYEICCA